MRKLLAVSAMGLLVAVLASRAPGFSSIAGHADNHRPLTRAALGDLGTEYPDVKAGAYSEALIEGSATEASHYDPYTQIETWADGHARWERYARSRYDQGEFEDAYNKFGYVVHLVEDDFSPPHKYVIYHGWVQWDAFEYRTAPDYDNRIPTSDPGFAGMADRGYPFTRADFEEIRSRNWLVLSQGGFVPPPHGTRRFWLSDLEDDDDFDDNPVDAGDRSTPDFDAPSGHVDAYQITSTWGSYGGQHRDGDAIPGDGNENGDWFRNASVLSTVGERIVLQSLWEARVAARDTLRRISQSLPPLARGYIVGDGTADPARIDRNVGTPVEFQIYENRTPDVFVTLDLPHRGAIRDASGEVWNRKRISIPKGSGPLPFIQKVSLTWKGELSDGSSLFDENRNAGSYELRLRLEDADGNHTPAGGVNLPLARRGTDAWSYHVWNVEVANTPPFVRALHVHQDSTLIYSAAWGSGGEQRTLQGLDEALPVLLTEAAQAGAVVFDVEFSQPVRAPTLALQGERVDLSPGNSPDPARWTGSLAIAALRRHANVTELQVEINANDRRDTPLDADPSTIAVRVGGTWEGSETGPDRSHKLKLSGDGWDVYSLYREYIVRYVADAARISQGVLRKARLVAVDRDEKPIDGEGLLGGRLGLAACQRELQQSLEALDGKWEKLRKRELDLPGFLIHAHAIVDAACGWIYQVQADECDCSTGLNEVWQTRDSWRLYNKYDYFHLTDEQRSELLALEREVRKDALSRHEMDTRRLLRRRRVLCNDLFRLEDFNARAGREAVAKNFHDRAYWWWEVDIAKRGLKFDGSSGLDNAVCETNHVYQIDWVQMKFWFLENVPSELEMEEALRAEPVDSLRPRR